MLLLCFLSITSAAVIENSQPIETNAANVAQQIAPEDKKSDDDNSDLETAEFKHGFRRKFGGFGYGVPVVVPVAVPVAPVYVPVQPVIQPVHVQPVHVQPVQYQYVHTPDCGCNGGGHQGGHSFGYNYNYHYSHF